MIFIVNAFQLILLILGYFRYNLVNLIKSGLSGLDYSEELNELTGFIGFHIQIIVVLNVDTLELFCKKDIYDIFFNSSY